MSRRPEQTQRAMRQHFRRHARSVGSWLGGVLTAIGVGAAVSVAFLFLPSQRPASTCEGPCEGRCADAPPEANTVRAGNPAGFQAPDPARTL